MSNLHAILDCETFGQFPETCAVIDFSYYVFDFDRFTSSNPYTFKELLFDIRKDKLNVASQVKKFGYKVEKSSLEFWGKQSPEVRKNIAPKEYDIELSTFMDNLIGYFGDFKGLKAWWTRSNTFDPIILWRIAKSTGNTSRIDEVLKFWKVRDVRTFIDSKTNFTFFKNGFTPVKDANMWKSEFKEHDSTHDVAADILRMQTLVRLDNDLEILE